MEKRKVKLSIVILSFNTRQLLGRCLESVVRCLVIGDRGKKITNTKPLAPNTQIIVVDNGSTDGSIELINEFRELKNFKNKSVNSLIRNSVIVKSIINKENLGYAKANNQGIKVAEGEYVMMLNSDTEIKDDALSKLVGFLDENKEIDIVGPKLLNTDGSAQANCGRFPSLFVSCIMLFKEHFGGSDLVRFSPKQNQLVDWLMGAAFLARKKVFETIGGFDEKIFMYMEEVEWFYRAKKAGFQAYFLKEAQITHLGLGSATSGRVEPILNIYRGLIYFYRKHKNTFELLILEIMLKLKAIVALLIGYFRNDNYLRKTYGEALKIY